MDSPTLGGVTSPMEALRFSCIPGCTNCCRVKGYVYLTEQDVIRAAAYLKLDKEAFEAKYIYQTRHTIRFRKPPVGQCHFLEEGGCSIHPAKPTQCRVYPFWPELVENRHAWEEQSATTCPGIGTGPLIQIGTALERSNEMRSAYPDMYDDSPI